MTLIIIVAAILSMLLSVYGPGASKAAAGPDEGHSGLDSRLSRLIGAAKKGKPA